MSRLESQVAAALQAGLPLTSRPYLAVADALGCGEGDVLAAADGLARRGLVRSFGAFVDYERLGYVGVLCGLAIPSADVGRVAELLHERPEVTHNYLRAHDVNMWCTALLKDDGVADFAHFLSDGAACPFVMLRTMRRFKLAPDFRLEPDPPVLPMYPADDDDDDETGELPNGNEQRILSRLQRDFPLEASPYAACAATLGMTEEALLAFLRRMRRAGVLRRIGVSLHHVRAGYRANALFACETKDPQTAGAALSAYPWVSHCYLRTTVVSTLAVPWPYGLYAMTHAKSGDELSQRAKEVQDTTALRDNIIMLQTLEELKKTRFILQTN